MELVVSIAVVTSLACGIVYIANLRMGLDLATQGMERFQGLYNEYHAKYEEQRMEAHLLAQRLDGKDFSPQPVFCAQCDREMDSTMLAVRRDAAN